MATLFTVLACFAGVFAFAFGLAGLLGLLDHQPPKDKRHLSLFLIDHLIAAGVVSTVREAGNSWEKRPKERNLLCTGFVCGVLCLLLLGLASYL